MSYDFKKEEDVKEFLDNIATEYRFGCFSEKNPESCHLLGDYLDTIKRDYEKSAKIFRSNCDDYSYFHSCLKYGNYKFHGKGVKRDSTEALKYFEKGCSGGVTEACLNGGLVAVHHAKSEDKFTPNYLKGMELLGKACDKGIAYGCHYIAGMYIRGVDDLIPKDMKKAFEYSLKGCDLGSMHACFNVSQMYKKGDGTTVNLVKSEEYKKKADEIKNKILNEKPITFQKGS